jgi:hypothetical protein
MKSELRSGWCQSSNQRRDSHPIPLDDSSIGKQQHEFPLLLRFGGNLFYVVQRYRKTATPKLDCHKDFHCPVQNMHEFISHVYKVAQTQK